MKQCKKCGGTGVIYDNVIQAGTYGELKLCDCITKKCSCGELPPYQIFDSDNNHSWCVCRTARTQLIKTKKAFKDSNIPKKYAWKFYEDFEIVNPTANKVLGFIADIRMSPSEKWNSGFYMWGQAGSGKTLLACIALQELMLRYGRGGKFVDLSRQFFQRLKSSYDSSDASYGTSGRILEELIRIPFLVIDDFGVQRNTDWEAEMLYNLIDSRYSEERVTIITSNDSIAKYKDVSNGRVYSRILEMCRIIPVDLPDYREGLSEYI